MAKGIGNYAEQKQAKKDNKRERPDHKKKDSFRRVKKARGKHPTYAENSQEPG